MRPVVVVHVSYFILPRTLSRLFDVNLWLLLLSFTCLFFYHSAPAIFPSFSCPTGQTKYGSSCRDVDECAWRPCRRFGSTCVNYEDERGYECICPLGYMGKHCDLESLAPPSPPRPISSLLSSLVWPPSSVCLTPHGLSLDCYLSSSPFHLF